MKKNKGQSTIGVFQNTYSLILNIIKHYLSKEGKQYNETTWVQQLRNSLSQYSFSLITGTFLELLFTSSLRYSCSLHLIFPKKMQLENLAPPIANNRHTSCEEDSQCRGSPCNGRRSHCMWHWGQTSALCQWNLSLRTWRDIFQSKQTYS